MTRCWNSSCFRDHVKGASMFDINWTQVTPKRTDDKYFIWLNSEAYLVMWWLEWQLLKHYWRYKWTLARTCRWPITSITWCVTLCWRFGPDAILNQPNQSVWGGNCERLFSISTLCMSTVTRTTSQMYQRLSNNDTICLKSADNDVMLRYWKQSFMSDFEKFGR